MTTNQNERDAQKLPNQPPPVDISPRMIQLARTIDHLPAGQYTIALRKQPAPQEWTVEINRVITTRIIGDNHA